MPLDNAQLKEFCNQDLRQIADAFVRLKTRVEAANEVYAARNLGTIINDGGSTNIILDGSETDGRTIATGGDVYNFVTMLQDFEVFLTDSRMDVVFKWNVNGGRV